jgi:EAL and modified HD-GYP domain-containing signal transduction protein
MSISVTFNSTHRVLLASEFFMARRPVVDRQQRRVAHELMFCNIDDTAGVNEAADASVIADVYQHGMDRVIGDLVGLLYIDVDALMSDIFRVLPSQKVVFELAEVAVATPRIIDRLTELTRAGFHFALSVSADNEEVRKLLPLVEGVRIDITDRDPADLRGLCKLCQSQQKKLLAERVETIEQFNACFELGFDFFQGYYFLKPHIHEGRQLSPSHLAVTELMALVVSDADTAVIENSIKADVALALNLLRLVNTPALSGHRIDSLRQALMVLGRDQLQRWLQILLYADPALNIPSVMPLLAQATMRGRLIELVAQKLRPGNLSIADTGFMVGIMSLMDTLFSMPMEDILQQIPVIDEVSEALLYRQGYFGQLLALAEYTEWERKNDALLRLVMRDLKLSYDDLYMLQLAAFEWSDNVVRNVR